MNSTQELFVALESGLPCTEIQRIIDNGADLCYKDPISGEYPLTMALKKNLPLEYIQILYHESLPSDTFNTIKFSVLLKQQPIL